jgi:hypothetical protein
MEKVNNIFKNMWNVLFLPYALAAIFIFGTERVGVVDGVTALGQTFQMIGMFSGLVALICWPTAIAQSKKGKQGLALALYIVPLVYTFICGGVVFFWTVPVVPVVVS